MIDNYSNYGKFNGSWTKQISHLNAIAFKCEICDKEYKYNKGLKNHVNITHNLGKECRCNICQKVFNSQKQLTVHLKSIHANKDHKCNSCGKSFLGSGILKTHINSVHNGQKDHKCNLR